MKVLIFMCIFMSSCLQAEQVLKEHVKNKFTKYHNNIRELRRRPPLKWSERLAADAHMNVLELSVSCFVNDTGNKGANILQVWGVRPYTPSKVIVSWLREKKSRSVILDPNKKFIGCAYMPCRDKGSFATSVIYVCHYSEKYQ